MQQVFLELMPWKEEYSVQIRSIDEQHKKLVSLINHLHSAMKEGKGNAYVGMVVRELIRYTQTHFAYEEKLFSRYGYQGFTEHKAEHDRFIEEVSQFDQRLARGSVTLSMEVMNFLKGWLSGHILKTDKSYSDFLIAKGVI